MNKEKNIKKPYLILISGIPNSGKSTTAIELATKLHIPVCLGTDEIKTLMRLYDNDFFINQDSYSCRPRFGNYKVWPFYHGYKRHCRAIYPGIVAVVKRAGKIGRSIIIEGVHLWPEINFDVENKFITYHFIITQSDYLKWQDNIEQKITGSSQKNVWQKHQDKYFFIQEKLKEMANSNKNIFVLEDGTPVENVQKIIKIICTEI